MSLKNHLAPIPAQSEQWQPRQTVTYASNEPMPPRTWLIVWGGLVLIWVAMFVFGYGILRNAGVSSSWSWPVALGLSIGGFVKVVQWVLPALTGDMPAVREIERNAETTMDRTEKEAGVWHHRFDNEREAEQHRHAEEMARIAHELRAQVDGMGRELADLRRGMVQYSGQIQRLQTPTFEAMGTWTEQSAAVSVDEEAALRWASSLYGEDGKPDPKKVVPDKGHLICKVPWNSEEDWPAGANSLLVDGPHGFQPVLERAGNSHNYKLNLSGYPTIQEVQNALGCVTAEGWVG